MGTRSLISARLGKTEEWQTIYCHWDGYIEGGVGEELHEKYDTIERISDLFAGGDLSSIHEIKHYHAWRDEPWEDVKPRVTQTLEEAFNFDMGQEFHYSWDNRDGLDVKWRVGKDRGLVEKCL
tara:strand:+ start:3169 stop:3537 length:369 start_codon:yes stop_codon:yes gene_type:complete